MNCYLSESLISLNGDDESCQKLLPDGYRFVNRKDRADVLICKLAKQVDQQYLEKFCRLKFIVTLTTGTTHISLTSCAKKNIKVYTLFEFPALLEELNDTAHLNLLMILSLLRSFLPFCNDCRRLGSVDRYKHPNQSLTGLSVGLLGYGRLGKKLYEYLDVLGAKVRVFDICHEKVPKELRCDSMTELFSSSSLVSININENINQEPIVNSTILSCLPLKSFVVNTSRASVIDQACILQMLCDGRIAGYATDVFNLHDAQTNYPGLLEDCRSHPGFIVTPHIGGGTYESIAKVEKSVLSSLHELLAEEPK